jgi:hypothetical protein
MKKPSIIKEALRLVVCLLAFSTAHLLGQQSPGMPPPAPAASRSSLTKFDLDFPGGRPADLVSAIEKATGRPLNVIILPEDVSEQLPPLKMTQVDVVELFSALQAAAPQPQGMTQYGFSSNGSNAPVSDDTIWYFYVRNPNSNECVFFSLASLLDHGFTVDDITTAIRTGWQMLVDRDPEAGEPSSVIDGQVDPRMAANIGPDAGRLSFHTETKLLIVVGTEQQISTAANALRVLETANESSAALQQSEATSLAIQSLRDEIDKLQKQVNQPGSGKPAASP